MILIVGASSSLGRIVVQKLLAQGKSVRAMTRTPSKVEKLKKLGAEVVTGDLRDPTSLTKACEGAEQVLASAHGFPGQGDNIPKSVDGVGNRHLIDAAQATGVKHFVLMSILGARPDHSVDMFRYKYEAEQYLRASGLSYTILRSAAFMEFWASLVGQPVIEKGKTTIFGRGKNPINFVSVDDVASFVLVALEGPNTRNQIIEIGGPENVTMLQVVEIFERVSGRSAKRSHVPLPMMRLIAVLMRLVNPAMSRQITAGICLDTENQTFDMAETLKRFPMSLKRLEEVVRSKYAK